MRITSAVFHSSAPDLATCPESDRPEFAFIGRSNVGKSSLVNMLTGKKDLAKVSAMPGKTRLINFFTINNAWSLVDLPGYGYAKVARTERGKFSSFVADYLQHRPRLVGTFVLIDSRIAPQKLDLEFLHWMVTHGLPFVLLFTKTDGLSKKTLQAHMDAFLECLKEISEETPEVLTCSSKQREGRSEILALIHAALSETSPHDA